jgi:hypothetical protein
MNKSYEEAAIIASAHRACIGADHPRCACSADMLEGQVHLKREVTRPGWPLPGNGGVRALLAAVCVLVVVRVHDAAGTGYQMCGSLEFTQMELSGKAVVENGFFRTEMDGCRWRIRTALREPDLTNNSGFYASCGYDGRVMYTLSSLGPGLEGIAANPSHPIQKTATIDYKEFPVFDNSKVTFVWLAFASGCYLEKNHFSKSRPVWAASRIVFSDPQGFLQTRCEFLDQLRRFPRSIDFLCDGNAFIDLAEPPSTPIRYPAPFDKGFLKAKYEVTATATYDGSTVPMEFTLVVYNPLPNGNTTNDLFPAWHITGRVSSIKRMEEALDVRPETAGVMVVRDLRYSSNAPVVFEYVTSSWRSDSDQDVRKQLASFKKATKVYVQNDAVRRWIVISVLMLAILAVSSALLREMRKRGHYNNNNP